jgi:hypothetical protein
MARKYFSTRKLKKESRTIPLYGDGVEEADENGQYYKCWNCGWVCDTERDELGGSSDRDGLTYENYSVDGFDSTPGETRLAVLGGDIEHFQVALELDAEGNPLPIDEYWRAVASSGCPFCGTRNWRGDF